MSADEFVSGTSADWAGVARRVFGYIFGAGITALVGYIQLVGDGVVAVISAPGRYYSWIIGRILALPTEPFTQVPIDDTDLWYPEEVVGAALPWIESTGPFALLVGLAIGGGMGYLMIRGIIMAYSWLMGGVA